MADSGIQNISLTDHGISLTDQVHDDSKNTAADGSPDFTVEQTLSKTLKICISLRGCKSCLPRLVRATCISHEQDAWAKARKTSSIRVPPLWHDTLLTCRLGHPMFRLKGQQFRLKSLGNQEAICFLKTSSQPQENLLPNKRQAKTKLTRAEQLIGSQGRLQKTEDQRGLKRKGHHLASIGQQV